MTFVMKLEFVNLPEKESWKESIEKLNTRLAELGENVVDVQIIPTSFGNKDASAIIKYREVSQT